MSYSNNRRANTISLAEKQVPHTFTIFRVETGCWLVDEEIGWLPDQCTADGHSLEFTSRQPGNCVVGQLVNSNCLTEFFKPGPMTFDNRVSRTT